MEIDSFYDDIKIDSVGTHRVTIPKKLMLFMGLKTGDQVKIYIKKITNERQD